ncbi:MAG: 4Fe-4S dicluster domain-containing protein [Deltaproteobacteria bacterium]|nr:4Fe-4S dicluster domain-containing protein [Deltaproteobacteria bacterium]
MTELRELAKKLLAEGAAKVVIGWEEGPRGVRPAFATDAAAADRLVFDARCAHDLAPYLDRRRVHVAKLGRPAVVVKPCDARAVAGLIRETQVKREDVVLVGVRCGGVLADPEAGGTLSADTIADRCRTCDSRETALADHVVGTPVEPLAAPSRRDARVAELDAMTPAQRWAFWQGELARCTRCNACRQVCPLCYCDRCMADKTQPQWIESSPHGRGNLSWHLLRAIHLAGRCVDCGECERACPSGIPLGLITRKVASVVADRFGHKPGDDPAVPSPIGTWRSDDPQEFIL